jgi:hypothetical protein
MTENNSRIFGPGDSMSWNTSGLAWVFAANSKAALDDPNRRVHGYLRDVIRIAGTEKPYIVRPRGKSGRSATAFAWVREAEL